MFESNNKIQKRSAKGFTLIELLVVVVIVGILAAVALPNFLGQSGKARTTEATASIDAMKSGQESWLNDNGTYFAAGDAADAKLNITANSDSNQEVVATAGSLASISTALGVNFDTNKFSTSVANGTRWVVAVETSAAPSNSTNYGVAVDGGAVSSTATGSLKGLASVYVRSNARIFIDGNSTI